MVWLPLATAGVSILSQLWAGKVQQEGIEQQIAATKAANAEGRRNWREAMQFQYRQEKRNVLNDAVNRANSILSNNVALQDRLSKIWSGR